MNRHLVNRLARLERPLLARVEQARQRGAPGSEAELAAQLRDMSDAQLAAYCTRVVHILAAELDGSVAQHEDAPVTDAEVGVIRARGGPETREMLDACLFFLMPPPGGLPADTACHGG